MGQTIINNKKANHDYFLEDRWECGLVLIGAEVKSIRAGLVSFKDTFARIEGGEMFLHNLHISPYNPASYMNEEPDRIRKLLLHKKEIQRIDTKVKQNMLTLVPTRLYFNNRGFLKIEIALGRGKKLYDKRESLKDKSIKRMINRSVRQFKK